jgi:hypothetical protein
VAASWASVWVPRSSGHHHFVQMTVDSGDDGVGDGPVDLEDGSNAEERLEQIREDLDAEDDTLGRQRRQNVRVEVQLPITLYLAGRVAPGRTRDISATGIGFSTRLPIDIDQRGDVLVEFEGWRFRKSFIVKFAKPILAGSQVGVQFEELTQEEREKLVKQVFDVQRSQLQGSRRR